MGSRLYCSYVSPSCLSSLPSFVLVAFKVFAEEKIYKHFREVVKGIRKELRIRTAVVNS